MPWKEHRVMSSKIAFVEEASQPDANIAALCRKHGISRPTGYEALRRFKKDGYAGLEELSRRPKSTPLATAEDIVAAIVEARAKHPRWGAKKLVVVLRRKFGELTPSVRTVHRVLERFGQIRARRKRRPLSVVDKAPTVAASKPNDVWTIDFKGWWRTQDGNRCDPLTIRDAYSRYVLALVLVPRCTTENVRTIMERLFRQHGVPQAIHCDNGPPFISVQAAGGLSMLSAWWVALGIQVLRSRPGCPQDNGAHERMHVDVAGDLQTDPAVSVELQQRACDKWKQTFNHVRPHEALGNKTPAELYKSAPSKKPLERVPAYPLDWLKRKVTKNGSVTVGFDSAFVSTALRGYFVGLQPLPGVRYRVWFYELAICEVEIANLDEEQVHQLVG
jgi:transposase InsO family protein